MIQRKANGVDISEHDKTEVQLFMKEFGEIPQIKEPRYITKMRNYYKSL